MFIQDNTENYILIGVLSYVCVILLVPSIFFAVPLSTTTIELTQSGHNHKAELHTEATAHITGASLESRQTESLT